MFLVGRRETKVWFSSAWLINLILEHLSSLYRCKNSIISWLMEVRCILVQKRMVIRHNDLMTSSWCHTLFWRTTANWFCPLDPAKGIAPRPRQGRYPLESCIQGCCLQISVFKSSYLSLWVCTLHLKSQWVNRTHPILILIVITQKYVDTTKITNK